MTTHGTVTGRWYAGAPSRKIKHTMNTDYSAIELRMCSLLGMDRTEAKALTFKKLYGGSVDNTALTTGDLVEKISELVQMHKKYGMGTKYEEINKRLLTIVELIKLD